MLSSCSVVGSSSAGGDDGADRWRELIGGGIGARGGGTGLVSPGGEPFWLCKEQQLVATDSLIGKWEQLLKKSNNNRVLRRRKRLTNLSNFIDINSQFIYFFHYFGQDIGVLIRNCIFYKLGLWNHFEEFFGSKCNHSNKIIQSPLGIML